MFNKCHCPKAILSDNTLILSLPDAITPVMWMIDLKEAGSFVMRVEKNDAGLYVLQKLSTNGKNLEDIAFYSEEKKAVRALTKITKSMGKSHIGNSTAGKLLNGFKTLAAALVAIAFFAGLYYIVLQPIALNILSSQPHHEASIQPPVIETNPDAIGVPMSADAFLKKRDNSAFPF